MTITIRLDNWSAHMDAARRVRTEVFIIEQQIPKDLEWDEMDQHCMHAVASDANNQPVGTGRLLPDGHIGRMAVLASARGLGIGGQLLQCLMKAAQARGDRRVELSAQGQATGFYSRYGFNVIGEPYLEAGILHIDMEHIFAS